MSKDLGVSGPVEIKDNSKERVAFDLMAVIVNNESRAKQERNSFLPTNCCTACGTRIRKTYE